MATYMKTFDHGTGMIDLSDKTSLVEMTPVELHIKRDGDKEDQPSLAVVMQLKNVYVVGQMSLKTLDDCLQELGYKITKL